MLCLPSGYQIFLLSFEGGSQFKITLNDTILINRIDAETGDRIRIEKVSLVDCFFGFNNGRFLLAKVSVGVLSV